MQWLKINWWKVTNAYDIFPHGDSRHYWYFVCFNEVEIDLWHFPWHRNLIETLYLAYDVLEMSYFVCCFCFPIWPITSIKIRPLCVRLEWFWMCGRHFGLFFTDGHKVATFQFISPTVEWSLTPLQQLVKLSSLK